MKNSYQKNNYLGLFMTELKKIIQTGWWLALILCFVVVGKAEAKVEVKGGENIELNSMVFEGETFVAGAMITGAPEIKGDAWIIGSNLEISGNYGDDLNAAGGQVNIAGEIKDNLRVASGNVKLDSKVDGNVYLAGGQIDINKDAVIKGDLLVAGGMVTLRGSVEGDVRIAGGQVTIDGPIKGNLYLEADEIKITENAIINGNFLYTSSKKIENLKSGQVIGETRFTEAVEEKVGETGQKISQTASIVGKITSMIMSFIGMLLVGLALILIAPTFVDKSSYYFQKKMGWSLLYGIVMAIVTPVVCIFLMVTMVGIPLSLIVLVMYFIGLYLSYLLAGFALGSVLLNRKSIKIAPMLLSLALGVLVIQIIGVIPWIGWIFTTVFSLVSLGTIWMWFYKRRIAE